MSCRFAFVATLAAALVLCVAGSLVSNNNVTVPPLPFSAYKAAGTFSVVDRDKGDIINNGTFVFNVNLTSRITCLVEAVNSAVSAYPFSSYVRDYADGIEFSQDTQATTAIQRCASVNISTHMPPGGAEVLAPATGSVVVNVSKAAHSIAYELRNSQGIQVWTVSAAKPHVPVSLETITSEQVAVVTFAQYERLPAMEAVCHPAAMNCTSLTCVVNPAATAAALQGAIAWTCGPGLGNVDCSAIQQGGPSFYPNTPQAHATYAFGQYFDEHRATQGDAACGFNGNALLMPCYPGPARCGPNQNVGEEALTNALRWVCGSAGLGNCAAIQPGGAHFLPNNTRVHAAWAFDQYFRAYRCVPGADACDFNGTATLLLN